MTRLAVVLDFGAASPLTILASARGLAEVVFVCDADRPYVREHLADLAHLTEICDITGLPDDAALDQVAKRAPEAITRREGWLRLLFASCFFPRLFRGAPKLGSERRHLGLEACVGRARPGRLLARVG